jgi:hypothetical protein
MDLRALQSSAPIKADTDARARLHFCVASGQALGRRPILPFKPGLRGALPGKQQKPEWIGPFAFLVFWKRRPNFDLLQREKKQVDPFFGRLQSALKCSGAAGWVR